MKLKNILLGLLVITLFSCEKWFDVSSSTTIKGTEFFKSEQGFKDALTGVYALLVNDSLYGKELTYGYNDVRGQYWAVSGGSHIYKKSLDYDYTDATEVARINSIWSALYKAIANVNSILANIDNDKSIFTPGKYNLFKGEAYALRAMLHFDALRLYGVSPKAKDAMQTRSIPYYDNFTNIAQPILPMSEVLTKVVSDINTARNLLRDYDPYGPKYDSFDKGERDSTKRDIKLNYWATTALLARVELYGGHKSEALRAAKEIIGEVGSAPQRPFAINGDNKESNRLFNSEILFQIDVQKLEDKIDPQFGTNATSSTGGSGLIMSTSDVNYLFDSDNSADQEYRKTLWMRSTSGSSQTLNKFKSQTKIPMIRLAEVYYIAAECATDDDTAFGYLNAIRAGRGMAPQSSEDNDLMDVLEFEYMREFIGEGQAFYYFKRQGAGFVGVNYKRIAIDKYALPLSVNEIDFGKVE